MTSSLCLHAKKPNSLIRQPRELTHEAKWCHLAFADGVCIMHHAGGGVRPGLFGLCESGDSLVGVTGSKSDSFPVRVGQNFEAQPSC